VVVGIAGGGQRGTPTKHPVPCHADNLADSDQLLLCGDGLLGYLQRMSNYTIHKSGSVTPGLGSRPLSETARVRKYGRLRGIEEPSLFDRLRHMMGGDVLR
jgi:hypothetical protein